MGQVCWRDGLIVMWLDWGNLTVTTVASVSQTKLKTLLKNYQEIFQEGFGKMNSQRNLTSQASLQPEVSEVQTHFICPEKGS